MCVHLLPWPLASHPESVLYFTGEHSDVHLGERSVFSTHLDRVDSNL